MRRAIGALLVAAAAALCLAAPAQADEFGVKRFDFGFQDAAGRPATQAGSHPFSVVTTLDFNTTVDPINGVVPVDAVKDIHVELPPGQAGSLTAVAQCPASLFLADASNDTEDGPECPRGSQVGKIEYQLGGEDNLLRAPVYNVSPPPGIAVQLGFGAISGVPVTIDLSLNPLPPHNVIAKVENVSQALAIFSNRLTVWGNPADPVHDRERGPCLGSEADDVCPSNALNLPFITLPTACLGPLPTYYTVFSWQHPEIGVGGSQLTHDDAEPPAPIGMVGCGDLGFTPTATARATTKAASSPSGMDFTLSVDDPGLVSPDGRAQSAIKKAVVSLPEGFTANPSVADGLGTCGEAELAAETAFSEPGAGCPNSSKIGTVEVETPLLAERLRGSLFVAKPYENPFGSLLALYMVIRSPERGILITQPMRVESDAATGRLTTIADELPQLPFSHLDLHLRAGDRSPLASAPRCGSYDAPAVLTPWSGGPDFTSTSVFEITVGPDSGPCPGGGLPPFRPGLLAGTINNAGGHFSPFNIRLFRSDAEQEITHFSIKLPPGVAGKLAGIPYCPDAAIAAAKARTGRHGGEEELASPSCPAASQIGRTLVGSGVGPALTYVPGKLYLAGPVNGSPLSIVSITAAKVGPFDLGTVVVREALKIDPNTAEVSVDALGSDPIPHIIAGIPVHLRDIRVYVDRSEFVLNPTSCRATSTASTLLGAGLDFASEADDRPVTVSTHFQAADCSGLPFRPRLAFRLKGSHKRGGTPVFSSHLAMRGIGEAAIKEARVTLPHSEFLEQSHIRTVCTRAQFAAGDGNGVECPAGSIYGRAKASTPILDKPLEGPVFLRSSSHPLPDLVVALHNPQVDFNLVGRVDSLKGRIRLTFEGAPDAPLASFDLTMQGGKKGLLVNSTNLCKGVHRAKVSLTGHNGSVFRTKPALKASCSGGHQRGRKKRH